MILNDREQLSDAEAIEIVRRGGRAITKHSLHESENAASAICRHLRWRSIACDGKTDVIECAACGRQRLAKCDFDEEFA